jgi:hypothetical protein
MVYAKCCYSLLWNQLFSNSTAHVQYCDRPVIFCLHTHVQHCDITVICSPVISVFMRMCSIVTYLLYVPCPTAHVQHCDRPFIHRFHVLVHMCSIVTDLFFLSYCACEEL